ncbi:HAD-IIB family hydrolase [Propionibacteriaceae bacterium G1746]|uniref:HAD-IIB family hydrolase n=1 Tax=Aestuariimicrobium sp. G57 TaxID=3418485 RepID=UPI003C147201
MVQTPVRAVATDLDGTFLGADGVASQRNIDAVLRAAAQGVQVIFATGRPWRWLDVLTPLLDADPLVLASNGAVRYDLHHARVLSADLLDVASTLEVVADVRAADHRFSVGVELLEGYAVDAAFDVRGDRRHLVVEDSVEQAIERHSPVKLLVRGEGINTELLAAEVTPLVGDRMTTTWSYAADHGLLEISRTGVSKGTGLLTLLHEIDIDPADVAAFGDMPNDLSMLTAVGRPFRMLQAHPLLHDFPVAGDHDDSGVGRQIELLLAEDVRA